jgi:hypothetical protein
MSKDLMDSLRQQIGPMDALEDLATPAWYKDVVKYLADDRVVDEEKNAFLVFTQMMMLSAGEIGAGFTRPLDIYSRALTSASDDAGGGLAIDRKQARGIDAVVAGLTRYTSGFFNLAFGEENEYGVRMMGKPKESSLLDGPVKIPNPAGTVFGRTIQAPAKNINKLLGMVDKAPYKAESFTSGVPEFDSYVNKHITPLLDRKADLLLKNPLFLKAPQSKRIEMVDTIINNAERELMSLLDGGRIGDADDRLVRERAKYMTRDRQARKRAMKELEITVPEYKLSLTEMETLRRLMDLDKDETKRSLR